MLQAKHLPICRKVSANAKKRGTFDSTRQRQEALGPDAPVARRLATAAPGKRSTGGSTATAGNKTKVGSNLQQGLSEQQGVAHMLLNATCWRRRCPAGSKSTQNWWRRSAPLGRYSNFWIKEVQWLISPRPRGARISTTSPVATVLDGSIRMYMSAMPPFVQNRPSARPSVVARQALLCTRRSCLTREPSTSRPALLDETFRHHKACDARRNIPMHPLQRPSLPLALETPAHQHPECPLQELDP